MTLPLLALLAACAGGDPSKDPSGGDDTAACTPATWHRDADGDGYGDATATTEACEQPEGYVDDATDCDDEAGAVHPGAPEIWYDGADEDCLGGDDFDQDADGVGRTTDCDDTDPDVHPGVQEDCATEADDDCDGSTDAADALGCVTWYVDGDVDGAGGEDSVCACVAHPPYTVTEGGDCDDADSSVHPGATEVCDGLDQDCDEVPDNGLPFGYPDGDGDGYGDQGAEGSCAGGGVADHTDCDDTNRDVHPGLAEECDGVDQDCDGTADDGLALWYADRDGDGDGAGSPSCSPGADWATTGTDCDDADRAVYTGAPELCDLRQNDCADGSWTSADEDGVVSFVDPTGAWTDVTSIVSGGVDGAPVEVELRSSGTFEWCPGTWYVSTTVPASLGVTAGWQFPYGAGSVTFNGGGVGRILSLEAGNGPFSVEGGAFEGGWASNGGAIWNDGNELSVQDARFSENVATFAGGAIAQAGGSLTLRGVTAGYNDAAAWGGAIYAGDASLAVSSTTFAYNEVTGGTGDGAYGGAVCVFSTAGNIAASIEGSTFLGNEATTSVEDLAVGGAVSFEVAGPADLSVSDTTFSGNYASSLSGAFGGAVSANVSGATTVSLTGVYEAYSYAYAPDRAMGGGIYVGNGATGGVSLTDVTLYQNAVYCDGEGHGAGLAYAATSTSSVLSMDGLESSVAWTYDSVGALYGDGGGMYLGLEGYHADLSDVQVHENAAATGAGISMDLSGGAYVTMDGGSLVSANEGTGVRVDVSGTYGYLYVTDASFEANTGNGVELDAASGSSGTLYLYGSTGRQGSLGNGGIGVMSGCGSTSAGTCTLYASLWDLGEPGTSDDNASGDLLFFSRLFDRLGTDWSGTCVGTTC